MSNWVPIAAADDFEDEDVVRFDHDGRTFAIYRDDVGAFTASDGLCTHERVHLADGFVIGKSIECPRHQGRFSIADGKALRPPACVDLRMHPVKIEDGMVFIDLGMAGDEPR